MQINFLDYDTEDSECVFGGGGIDGDSEFVF
jgi:hypothetical protein